MNLLWLAWQSWRNRRLSVILSILAIALSVGLFVSIEQLRKGVRKSAQGTISGTDLIVGPRGGATEILLYSVFHIGQPKNNISFRAFQQIAKDREVEWAIPFSIGDSHRGYRVLGTTSEFYQHYRYRQKKKIAFARGEKPAKLFDVVIGSAIAEKLKYAMGHKLRLSHGLGEGGAYNHQNLPFKVVGILQPTQTPIDRVLLVSLEAIEAIHQGWQSGIPPEEEISASALAKSRLKVDEISVFLLGLKSKIAILQMLRNINTNEGEPLTAILPALEMQRLYSALSFGEDALRLVAILVVLVSLVSMLIAIYSSLQQRRREMAIFRAIGARPGHIFSLFLYESLMLCLLGSAMGFGFAYLGLLIAQPFIEDSTGIYVYLSAPGAYESLFFGGLLAASALVGLLPATRAYKNTLADGLSVRI